MTRTHLALPFALLALAACVDETEDRLGSTDHDLIACPKWGCSENSPILGPFGMHELEELGTPNDAGISVIALRKGAASYRVDVAADRLRGLNPNGSIGLQGAALIGSTIRLSTPSGPASLHIMNVSETVKFWRGPATTVETYELGWTGAGYPNMAAPYPLCLNPPNRLDGEGQYWLKPYEAILYTGDRYDADAKLVTAASYRGAGTWFNIACAGGALAKLHLNRHTTAGTVAGFQSTVPQRQAMLKMYTGDFCGTGEAFTRQGTSLRWTSDQGGSSVGGGTASYESLWTADGAICLSTHRLHGSAYDMDAELGATCALPTCSSVAGFPGPAGTGAYLLTQSAAIP
ncbi:MAG: hypothetical protein IPL61_26830 [Myxococcales bacterium]|nr:hypothetical protein [Myxococcales bacterium]